MAKPKLLLSLTIDEMDGNGYRYDFTFRKLGEKDCFVYYTVTTKTIDGYDVLIHDGRYKDNIPLVDYEDLHNFFFSLKKKIYEDVQDMSNKRR
jgi:hypothetical protein